MSKQSYFIAGVWASVLIAFLIGCMWAITGNHDELAIHERINCEAMTIQVQSRGASGWPEYNKVYEEYCADHYAVPKEIYLDVLAYYRNRCADAIGFENSYSIYARDCLEKAKMIGIK